MVSIRPPQLFASLLCAAALSVAGCSDGLPAVPDMLTAPDGGFIINGHPFAAVGQGATSVMTNEKPPRPGGWIVYLSDRFDSCNAIAFPLPSDTVLYFQLPVNPVGVFNVTEGNTVFTVGKTPAAVPLSGTIQVNAHTAQQIAGTYDVTFKSGEHLTSVFASPICW